MKNFFIFLFIFFISAQVVFANAATKLEQVNKLSIENSKNDKISPKKDVQKNNYKTNYQYDNENYEYNRVKKYIQDNIDYSKSGETLRFN